MKGRVPFYLATKSPSHVFHFSSETFIDTIKDFLKLTFSPMEAEKEFEAGF